MLIAENFYNSHPGRIILKVITRKGISQAALARLAECKPQELNAIIQCKRTVPLALGLRIERILDMEEGFFGKIQLQNSIASIKHQATKSEKATPSIRSIVFWDIDMSKLDWIKNRDFIIKRVREYGNNYELSQINEYYGIS